MNVRSMGTVLYAYKYIPLRTRLRMICKWLQREIFVCLVYAVPAGVKWTLHSLTNNSQKLVCEHCTGAILHLKLSWCFRGSPYCLYIQCNKNQALEISYVGNRKWHKCTSGAIIPVIHNLEGKSLKWILDFRFLVGIGRKPRISH